MSHERLGNGDHEAYLRRPLIWTITPLIALGFALLFESSRIAVALNVDREIVLVTGGILVGLCSLLIDELTTRQGERRRSADTIESLKETVRDLQKTMDSRRFDKERSALQLGEMLALAVTASAGFTETRPQARDILGLCSNLGINVGDLGMSDLRDRIASGSADDAKAVYVDFSAQVGTALDDGLKCVFAVGQQVVNLSLLLSFYDSDDVTIELLSGIERQLRGAANASLTPRIHVLITEILQAIESFRLRGDFASDDARIALHTKVAALRDSVLQRSAPGV